MKFNTPVFQLKRMAKQLARGSGIPLNRALDEIARSQGFRDWAHYIFLERQERVAATLMKNLVAGDLVLLGARPRQGKTQLALKLLADAVQSGVHGCFFSLEYTSAENWRNLKRCGLTKENTQERLVVDTSNETSASYISEQISRIGGDAFVVVDYLQLLDQRRDNPALSDQIEELSVVAEKTRSIIVMLSQIDRKFTLSSKHVPDENDIRMPNPFALRHFTKTCFLHDEAYRINRCV